MEKDWADEVIVRLTARILSRSIHIVTSNYKKTLLSQGNRAMPQLFFSV